MNKLKAGFIGFVPFTAKGDEYYAILEETASSAIRALNTPAGCSRAI